MKKFLIWCCISLALFVFIVSGALVETLEAMTAAINAVDWEGSGRATGEFMGALVMWFIDPIMWVLDKF